jgi:SOS-response transcriptional repressor LexA
MKKNIQGWDSLHPNQQKLYEFLAKKDVSETVTLAEMAEALEASSLTTAVYHLRQLEKKGYIRRKGESGEYEILPSPARDIVYLNLYGTAACNPEGFFNEGNIVDRIPFPAKHMHIDEDSFLIEAKGKSMEPIIHNKDFVVVKEGPIENGQIALLVDHTGAKIKKVFKGTDQVILQSLNPKYEPTAVKAEDIHIIGLVKGVIRNFNLKI